MDVLKTSMDLLNVSFRLTRTAKLASISTLL